MSHTFISTSRLFVEEKYKKLCNCKIGIIGLGGVGSWAAEALARCGIRKLVLVDYDHVTQSNINRQIQANVNTLGMSKISALLSRLIEINPKIEVDLHDVFFSEKNNIEALNQQSTDFWIDACDDINAKIELINSFKKKERKKKIIICGGVGGKTNPFKIFQSDLCKTSNDRLLSKLRYKLRREHNFPRLGSMGIPVLSSNQNAIVLKNIKSSRIDCTGYGSIVNVTASLGLKASYVAIDQLLKR